MIFGTLNEFLSVANLESCNFKSLSPTDFDIRVEECECAEGDVPERLIVLTLHSSVNGGESVLYHFSDRALKNLKKLTGISTKLFKGLPCTSLIADIKSQLVKYPYIGLSLNPEDNTVVCMSNIESYPYISYEKLLEPFKDSISIIAGDPVREDFVEVQLSNIENENYIVGANMQISSTNNAKFQIVVGIIDKHSGIITRITDMWSTSLNGVLPLELETVVDTLNTKSEIVLDIYKSLLEIGNKADVTPENLESVVKMIPGSKNRDTMVSLVSNVNPNDPLLQSCGLQEVKTITDIFKVLSRLACNAKKDRSRISLGNKVYNWFLGYILVLKAGV